MKKRFTEEQIAKAISRLKNGTTAKELSQEMGVTPTTLYAWKRKFKDMTLKQNGCESSSRKIRSSRNSLPT